MVQENTVLTLPSLLTRPCFHTNSFLVYYGSVVWSSQYKTSITALMVEALPQQNEVLHIAGIRTHNLVIESAMLWPLVESMRV